MKALLIVPLVPFALLLVSASSWFFGSQQGKPQLPPKPPARKIPGITAEDRYPRGCVDCHINYVAMKLDVRFATLLKQWRREVPPKVLERSQRFARGGITLKGSHPEVSDTLKNIPATCIECHDEVSKKSSPAFGPMVHALHLDGGDSNDFMTLFQGECTHCHKRSTETGRWSIPNAPEK